MARATMLNHKGEAAEGGCEGSEKKRAQFPDDILVEDCFPGLLSREKHLYFKLCYFGLSGKSSPNS